MRRGAAASACTPAGVILAVGAAERTQWCSSRLCGVTAGMAVVSAAVSGRRQIWTLRVRRHGASRATITATVRVYIYSPDRLGQRR